MPVGIASAEPLAPTPLPSLPSAETAGNDTAATATPIASGHRVRGYIDTPGDVDCYSFASQAGQRVYAAVVTSAASAATRTWSSTTPMASRPLR